MGGRNTSRVALSAASILVTGGALWFVGRSFDWREFGELAGHLSIAWLTAAVAMDVLSYVCQGARWQQLLRPLHRVSLLTTTRAIYAGLFVNEVLPLRPGEVLRGLILAKEANYPASALLRSMLAERSMDAVILILAALFASTYTPLPGDIAFFVRIAASVLVTLLAATLVLRERIPEEWTASFRDPRAFAISTGVFLGQAAAVWCILRACSLELSPAEAFAITVILRIGTALPLAPANIGTHQLAVLAGLTLFGIRGAQATSIALIVFAVLTLPLLLLGALAFLQSRVTIRGEAGDAVTITP